MKKQIHAFSLPTSSGCQEARQELYMNRIKKHPEAEKQFGGNSYLVCETCWVVGDKMKMCFEEIQVAVVYILQKRQRNLDFKNCFITKITN